MWKRRRLKGFREIVIYILSNPERKGLVGRDGEYPYSGCPDPM
jgi:hypothetical protein